MVMLFAVASCSKDEPPHSEKCELLAFGRSLFVAILNAILFTGSCRVGGLQSSIWAVYSTLVLTTATVDHRTIPPIRTVSIRMAAIQTAAIQTAAIRTLADTHRADIRADFQASVLVVRTRTMAQTLLAPVVAVLDLAIHSAVASAMAVCHRTFTMATTTIAVSQFDRRPPARQHPQRMVWPATEVITDWFGIVQIKSQSSHLRRPEVIEKIIYFRYICFSRCIIIM